MFYVVSKQFLSGYVPMQIASSVDEALELISSYSKLDRSKFAAYDDGEDEAGNIKFKANDGVNFYEITRLLRS